MFLGCINAFLLVRVCLRFVALFGVALIRSCAERLSHRGIAFFSFFFGFDVGWGRERSGREVGLGEGAGGKDQVKGQDMSTYLIYKSTNGLASGYEDSFGRDGMRRQVGLREPGLERGGVGGGGGFIGVIRCQRRCVVLWRGSAACGRWKSRIARSVRSALRLARRA